MSVLLQWSFIYTYSRPPVTLELYARTAGYDFRIEALAPDIHGATTTAATINAISQSAVVPAMKLPRKFRPRRRKGAWRFCTLHIVRLVRQASTVQYSISMGPLHTTGPRQYCMNTSTPTDQGTSPNCERRIYIHVQ
jgi:hypothetical protein